ncbi:MAG: hypothetical protein GWO07_14395 [Candidatus Dadabacteria bacterium]|nr:hypothetical protein [Candidatus Dadabacteria bacterium]NIS09902.1 hypothetical protein [Candidatus Dadabacteria bacterium]NIV41731.1 hypothetical protein [Candidatus Dadabacteria bacterium]NIX16327.1 hypothetical protein [Candidatus Dadabacteria bacterium]NIY21148.1 hypothetical protein [Candidatus Dadabacteria bacterium]
MFIKKFLLTSGSVIFALLLAEGAARFILDPVDYLKPRKVDDKVLGFKLIPDSGGHDRWGYRNKSVPDKSDIVAIGDSHTYGISAKASDSWPAALENISGKETYNMSLPGYGPVQYYQLLKTKAFELKPSTIVAALYLGNDILDVYNIVYNNENWSHLRKAGFKSWEIAKKKKKDRNSYKYKLRHFLPGNSVIYRIISSSVIGDELRQLRRLYEGEKIIMYEDKQYNIQTGFMPAVRLKALNLKIPRVREGLRISLDLIDRMSELCRERSTDFLVLLLPTKESVYADFIENNPSLPDSELIDELLKNENEVRGLVLKHLTNNKISYVNALDALRNRTRYEQLYPTNFGTHSNKNGYKIIAGSVARNLSKN